MAGIDARIGWLTTGKHVHVDMVCCVLCGLGMCFISGYVLLRDGSMYACMYVYDDGLEPEYVLFDVHMYACLCV